MDNKLKYVQLYEEFVSIEIEDSTVNINIDADDAKNTPPALTDLSNAKPGDEVIVDIPMMSLNQTEPGESEPNEDVKESEEPDDTKGENEDTENPDIDKEIEGD